MKRLLIPLIGAGLWMSSAFAAELEVSNVWLRETVPGAPNGAAYLSITNHSDVNVGLVSASTPAARAVEVHETVMRDGMMRMRRVPNLEIAVDTTVELKPGSYHLMLFGLVKPLVAGEQVSLTLQFADGQTLDVTGVVKTID